MTLNNKSDRNYRGKCLGWPVTSYGAALHSEVKNQLDPIGGLFKFRGDIRTN